MKRIAAKYGAEYAIQPRKKKRKGKKKKNPSRPPRKWWDRCVSRVAASGGAVSPAAVCGDLWYHELSQKERTALARKGEGGARSKKRGGSKKKPKAKKAADGPKAKFLRRMKADGKSEAQAKALWKMQRAAKAARKSKG
jgi:hypothetical protein